MRKKTKGIILRKREKWRKFCRKLTKYERLYVVSGRPVDLLRYFLMVLVVPGAYWCFVLGIPEDWRYLLLFYLAFDLLYTLWWVLRIFRRKEREEDLPLEEGGEGLEAVLEKLKELSEEESVEYGYKGDENGEWTDLFRR